MVIAGYKWLMALLSVALAAGPAERAPVSAKSIHPFYISVTEMNYNAVSGSLEISCKIFTDDLQKALAKIYTEKPDLFLEKDKVEAGKQIAGYLLKRLQIKINGKPAVPDFLGFERENDATWSYLEAAHSPTPRLVEISNSILYDSFDQQINLVHVTVGGERKSIKLQYPDTSVKFTF